MLWTRKQFFKEGKVVLSFSSEVFVGTRFVQIQEGFAKSVLSTQNIKVVSRILTYTSFEARLLLFVRFLQVSSDDTLSSCDTRNILQFHINSWYFGISLHFICWHSCPLNAGSCSVYQCLATPSRLASTHSTQLLNEARNDQPVQERSPSADAVRQHTQDYAAVP